MGILALMAALCLISTQKAEAQFALTGSGYDSHAELNWEEPAPTSPDRYLVFRSEDGEHFEQVASTMSRRSIDFTGYPGDLPQPFYYYISARSPINVELAVSDTIEVTVAAMEDAELLDMVQQYTFRYFWDFAHPVSGLTRERNTSGDIVTMGGSGFGVMAILVGIERGYITRQEGLNRMLQIVSFLQIADRFHGVFPHWMNGINGEVYPFSQFDDGADLVETAFLVQGLLTVREYFDRDDPYEDALRQAVTGIWEDVDWEFFRKNGSQVLYWHWSPNYAWQINLQIRGYNEALIIYLLAIASPTHPVPASLWDSGWAGQNYINGSTWFGYKLPLGPPLGGPLFFAHYSFLGFDPRNKKDAYANYFEQNRRHTLINRAYCIDNPLNFEGYSDVCWGLTASDDPFGYLAHAPGAGNDNGTITPTAALSSMPYTPAESMAALKHFYREHGELLWGEMGFYDAFNLSEDWFSTSYLAIDQGPIICMIENFRTGLLWDLFMRNPEITAALEAIGFEEDITSTVQAQENNDLRVYPVPTRQRITVELPDEGQKKVDISVHNLSGSVVMKHVQYHKAGAGRLTLDLSRLTPGMYFLNIQTGNERDVRRIIIQ